MAEIIPYTLKITKDHGKSYFDQIDRFGQEVFQWVFSRYGKTLREMKVLMGEHGVCQRKTEAEYAIEYLALGILWHEYHQRIRELPPFEHGTLVALRKIRSRGGGIKKVADRVRCILSAWWLHQQVGVGPIRLESPQDLKRLLLWLDAMGEHQWMLRSLNHWMGYFETLSEREWLKKVAEITSLVMWFQERSFAVLGAYTEGVKDFLSTQLSKYQFREDRGFCGRGELEYHFNLVGAAMMNSLYRKAFLSTPEKRVLLPICMRAKGARECKAVLEDGTYRCEGCDQSCQVNRIRRLGIAVGFSVYMIPHSSKAFREEEIPSGKVGIVGIACALNLMEGGYQALALQFVPQCVPLNFSGCKHHWHSKGIITDIDLSQLYGILNLSPEDALV